MAKKISLAKLPPGFLRSPINWLAIGFGSGLSPIMPGTAGTIIAIPIFLLLSHMALPFYILTLLLLIICGFRICETAEKKLKTNDPSIVVWDEIVGYLITMIAIPANWLWIILGFIFFRVLDMWKPWPIRWVNDNLHGGFGIMTDDILAGFGAWILLKIIVIFCG